MECTACGWHEYWQQTAVSIKLEPRSDNSLQLLLLIYADVRSNVEPPPGPLRLQGDTAPSELKKIYIKMQEASSVVHLFHLHDLHSLH